MKTRIQNKFAALSERDQRAATICGVFLAAIFIWFLALSPSYNYYSENRTRLSENTELGQWIEQNKDRFEAISVKTTPSQKLDETIDPLQRLSQLSEKHAITIDRIEPTSDERIRSTYTRVNFESFLAYIATIESEGLLIDSLSIDTTGASGFVNASLVVR